MMSIDELNGFARKSCTSGHRHFNVMPNGDMYRCVALYYAGKTGVIANITDHDSMQRIFSNKMPSPCSHGICALQCDGHKTEQVVDGMIDHCGSDVEGAGFVGRDYCILQVHMLSACNWSCEYCCASSWMRLRTQSVSTDHWRRFASILVDSYGTGMVLMMGGEPTIHPAWEEFAGRLLHASWHVRLVTNFSLHRKIERFARSLTESARKHFMVNVSLHPTQWKDGFDEYACAIDHLSEMRVPMSFTVVDTQDNRRLLEKYDVEAKCRKHPLVWFDYIRDITK
jgi:sulfatase maturation enzyme AslB (radical SAM superfamily)